eukprot:scaffold16542_cov152-Skeletonema_dohrnii-CCMP3373.AAC.2
MREASGKWPAACCVHLTRSGRLREGPKYIDAKTLVCGVDGVVRGGKMLGVVMEETMVRGEGGKRGALASEETQQQKGPNCFRGKH